MGITADGEIRPAHSIEFDAALRETLVDKCGDCHDATETNGDVNIVALTSELRVDEDLDAWIKIESAIVDNRMPPPDERRLGQDELELFEDWFQKQLVMPDGLQRPGVSQARRLTREELQNTLEDLLHVRIRSDVTNSRLHVIPDTIVEKFFAAGVVGESGFSNDAKTLSGEPIDVQTYARCFSLVLSLLDGDASARKRLFGTDSLPLNLTTERAAHIVREFGRAAFRRALTDQERTAFFDVYDSASKTRPSFQAMKSTFLAVLLSPMFLYRLEEPVTKVSLVSDDELAVRLAYFLWSSPPDDELLDLATEGELGDPVVLTGQVRRMLADPRRIALSENLGGEWFDYKQLRQKSSVDKRSDKMAGFYRTQYEEAVLLFDSLLRYDQEIFRIVDADWAFLNRHQSNIYQLKTERTKLDATEELPPVSLHFRSGDRKVRQGNYEYKHAPLEMVQVNDVDRVGFLTLGPTLTVTSTENRTSPIRRGVWVLERILGKHFVVPDDVPDLQLSQDKAKQQQLDLTPNEILKLHSSQDGCVSCHQFIDPIGFGLEQFDPLGIRRSVPDHIPDGEKLTWNPERTPASYADRTWTLTQPLVPGARTEVHFQYTAGGQRLNVRNVRIRSGEVELVDKHFGFAGGIHRDHVWHFSLPPDVPPNGWQLTAEMEGDGGTDSSGVITIAGPNDNRPGYRLPNGQSFHSPAELKDLLLDDFRDALINNVIRRVLSYALGRKLLPIDRPAIAEIEESLRSDGYRMTALLEAVAVSFPFRHKE